MGHVFGCASFMGMWHVCMWHVCVCVCVCVCVSLQLGIRYSVMRVTSDAEMRDPTPLDFKLKVKQFFPRIVSCVTHTHTEVHEALARRVCGCGLQSVHTCLDANPIEPA